MKKKLLSIFFALLLLLPAITAYAAGWPYSVNYSGGYKTPVRHFFSTELNKGSTQRWVGFRDYSPESIFVNMNTNQETSGYHTTKVVDQSGYTLLCPAQDVYPSETKFFYPTGNNAVLYDCIFVRYYNPNYSTQPSTRLRTRGTLSYNKMAN